MSRLMQSPLPIPPEVQLELSGGEVTVTGKNGRLSWLLHPLVQAQRQDQQIRFETRSGARQARALLGTSRALVRNMIIGVDQGFEKKLNIHGVGYRARMEQNGTLVLALGYSHPVQFAIPEGLEVQTPSQTEIVIRGSDKQKVGQLAAEIRASRPPEPYKGKGICYADEQILRKKPRKESTRG